MRWIWSWDKKKSGIINNLKPSKKAFIQVEISGHKEHFKVERLGDRFLKPCQVHVVADLIIQDNYFKPGLTMVGFVGNYDVINLYFNALIGGS